MKYDNIYTGKFIDRPNRFIANVEINGEPQVCHVKNTGRCKELLIKGCEVYVQYNPAPERKTQWDLIGVKKHTPQGDKIINIDSGAPNKVFAEYLAAGGPGRAENIRPEYTCGDSRFDFYFEKEGRPCLAEIKGVTLENDGVARFPDAPTQRGVKHLLGLARAAKDYETYIIFIVAMDGIKRVEPNWATHPQFGEALIKAREARVNIFAVGCHVDRDSITAGERIPVITDRPVIAES